MGIHLIPSRGTRPSSQYGRKPQWHQKTYFPLYKELISGIKRADPSDQTPNSTQYIGLPPKAGVPAISVKSFGKSDHTLFCIHSADDVPSEAIRTPDVSYQNKQPNCLYRNHFNFLIVGKGIFWGIHHPLYSLVFAQKSETHQSQQYLTQVCR